MRTGWPPSPPTKTCETIVKVSLQRMAHSLFPSIPENTKGLLTGLRTCWLPLARPGVHKIFKEEILSVKRLFNLI